MPTFWTNVYAQPEMFTGASRVPIEYVVIPDIGEPAEDGADPEFAVDENWEDE